MEKSKLKVLVVDRKLKKDEHPVVHIFRPYKDKGYDLIIFPWKEDNRETQVVGFCYQFISSFERLFFISIESAPDFFNFDLNDIDEEVFYEILGQEFEIENLRLSEVENK